MPSWPPELPEPTSGTLSIASRENVLTSQGDVGAPITRRRYTSRLIDYSATLYLSEALRKVLDDFHHNDCQDGSLSFVMPDWLGGASITCKWTSPPQYNQAGPSGRWATTISFVKIE